MTLGQNHDKSSGHKQSLCELKTSVVDPYKRYGSNTNFAQTDEQTDKLIVCVGIKTGPVKFVYNNCNIVENFHIYEL